MVLMQLLIPVSAQEKDYWEMTPVVLGCPMNVQLWTVDVSDISSKSQTRLNKLPFNGKYKRYENSLFF